MNVDPTTLKGTEVEAYRRGLQQAVDELVAPSPPEPSGPSLYPCRRCAAPGTQPTKVQVIPAGRFTFATWGWVCAACQPCYPEAGREEAVAEPEVVAITYGHTPEGRQPEGIRGDRRGRGYVPCKPNHQAKEPEPCPEMETGPAVLPTPNRTLADGPSEAPVKEIDGPRRPDGCAHHSAPTGQR